MVSRLFGAKPLPEPVLTIGPLGINFSEIVHVVIEIQTLSLKIDLKMSSVIFISQMEFYIHT